MPRKSVPVPEIIDTLCDRHAAFLRDLERGNRLSAHRGIADAVQAMRAVVSVPLTPELAVRYAEEALPLMATIRAVSTPKRQKEADRIIGDLSTVLAA